MLANIKILIVVLSEDNLLFVVLELEVRHVVLFDVGHLLTPRLLLLAVLVLLLKLLGRLLGLAGQVAGADLAAEDAGLRPVVVLDAEPNLGQDEFDLFAALHRAKRLDLQLTQDVGRRLEVALRLFDVGQNLGHAGALDLDKDLALGHGPQRLDQRQLGLEVRRRLQEAHDCLHHLGDGLLQLAVLLGEDERLFVEENPFALLLAECDNRNQYPGRRREI